MSRPPISVPITLPRSSSLASVAAYGTSIWTTTEVIAASAAATAEQREVRRDRAADQGDRADGEQPGQQRTAAGDVPGRHDEQQPDRVAELARRHQQRRGCPG